MLSYIELNHFIFFNSDFVPNSIDCSGIWMLHRQQETISDLYFYAL